MDYQTYEYPMVIKEYHLDTFGHVNNATYLQIYEEARWESITKKGYGLDKIKKTGLGPVILDLSIKFIKELRLREEIVIHTKTDYYKGKVGKIKQWITNSEGKICSEIEMTLGLFDTKNRQLVEPTEDWLNAIK